MTEALGQVVFLILAVSLSPIPLIAVVLLLSTQRARLNGPAFVAGWLVGVAAAGFVFLWLAGGADVDDSGANATAGNWLDVVLGVVVMAVAARQWRARPKPGEEPELPSWLKAIDKATPAKALGTGIVLSALNPKILFLVAGAAASIAETDLSNSEQAASMAIFALLATIGTAVPVAIYFVMGERASALLASWKTWLARENHTILAAIFFVIAVKLLFDGIGDLVL